MGEKAPSLRLSFGIMVPCSTFYILKLNNGILYIGYTTDLKRRIELHQTGEFKHSFTRKFLPISLVYYEAYRSKSDAMKRERNLKRFKSSYSQLKKRITSSIGSTPKRGLIVPHE